MFARPRVELSDDWRQIELLARAPDQRAYELIRPVVLFGQSSADQLDPNFELGLDAPPLSAPQLAAAIYRSPLSRSVAAWAVR